MKIPLLVGVFMGGILGGCGFGGSWTGFYYQNVYDTMDPDDWVTKEGFGSLESCREWAQAKVGNNSRAGYECGQGCRYEAAYGELVCKRTAQ